MSQDLVMYDLPLSWARSEVDVPRLRMLRLSLSRKVWIPCADVPKTWSFSRIFNELLKPMPHGFLLQGCNPNLARFLMVQGGQVAQVGVEAVLPLAGREKGSLVELARRGGRWGQVIELSPHETHRRQMAALWEQTAHGRKPQLQCAFRTDFDAHVRGFALEGEDGRWWGALTLSLMKPGYWHTELLLRRQDAPVGVMEALILAVKARLRDEGARWLSLGTVPFVEMADAVPGARCRWPWEAACRGRAIAWIGRRLRFSFEYQGLYRFKQKFQPQWQPLYLCGWPNLPWRILPDLSWHSRHLHLVGYAALQRVRRPGL